MPPGFDFPTNPATGTVVTVPDGSYRVWDSQKWRAAPSSNAIIPPTGFLPLTGGTLTGNLTLSGNATLALHAVPLQQLSSAVAAVSSSTVIATGGTASRTLADRFGQIIDIRDLGAACDGTTDDTAAWTAAFAKPDGTVIRIPQNCVTIVGDGFFRAGVRSISIIGDGRDSIIRLKTGTTLTHDLFTWNGGNNVKVENLTLDFNNCPQPSAITNLFYFLQAQGSIVRNVAVINGTPGIFMLTFSAASDFIVDNCYLQFTAGSSTVQCKGINSQGSVGANYRGRIVNNILINTNTVFVAANQFYVAGNDISGWGVGAGIAFMPTPLPSPLCMAIGNKLHDSLRAIDPFGESPNGIEKLEPRSVIANNQVWNCSGHGIAQSALNGLVVGNKCWDNNRLTPGGNWAGISAFLVAGSGDASGSTFIGNYCYDSGVGTQSYGFAIGNNGITNLLLDANRFSGTVADTFHLSFATYRNAIDYVPRTLFADPTTASVPPPSSMWIPNAARRGCSIRLVRWLGAVRIRRRTCCRLSLCQRIRWSMSEIG